MIRFDLDRLYVGHESRCFLDVSFVLRACDQKRPSRHLREKCQPGRIGRTLLFEEMPSGL